MTQRDRYPRVAGRVKSRRFSASPLSGAPGGVWSAEPSRRTRQRFSATGEPCCGLIPVADRANFPLGIPPGETPGPGSDPVLGLRCVPEVPWPLPDHSGCSHLHVGVLEVRPALGLCSWPLCFPECCPWVSDPTDNGLLLLLVFFWRGAVSEPHGSSWPRGRIKLQLPAYTTATATQDP